MLFGHSHGFHPSAQKIAMHHAIMGTMAVTAGSTKLVSAWVMPAERSGSTNGNGYGSLSFSLLGRSCSCIPSEPLPAHLSP